jgi:3-hydroxyisobutyrate dehydrogenase-like beta-hydroxyacid dehydrogenase
MGPVGAGQTTKLINQILVACTIAVVAEAAKLAGAAGIDAARLPECLKGGFADSPVMQAWLPRMLAREFEARRGGDAAIMLKDLDTAHALARATHTRLPMASAAIDLYRALAAKGGAAWDPAALISLYDPP